MAHDHAHAGDVGGTADPGDQEICVCFHVRRRKVEAYCRRERPRVVSLISECLSAGTGCGWCIPFLRAIHAEVVASGPAAVIPSREEYLAARKAFHRREGIVRP